MSIENFYNKIGGSANNILERLGEKSFVKKFIVKFLNDPTMDMLRKDVKNKDLNKATFDAHTLKGICSVLEFVRLKEFTEQFLLCLKQNENYNKSWKLLNNEYNFIIKTIKKENFEDCINFI